jgi:hypothetical protein
LPAPGLDASPRQYSPSVTLVRRSAQGPAAAPERTTAEEIEAWLLGAAVRENDLLARVDRECAAPRPELQEDASRSAATSPRASAWLS